MKLPFVQVASEVIEFSAPDLSVSLDWDESEAGWGMLKMFRWALGRCPDGKLPSEHAIVTGPSAAKLISRAAGYKGDPERFIDACGTLSHPVVQRVPEGVRICGLDRYDVAPEPVIAPLED